MAPSADNTARGRSCLPPKGQKHRNSRTHRPLRRTHSRLFDYLIVGAGFAGSGLAERLARETGRRVLLVDRRLHTGANAYDHFDDAGIRVHRYGPHIFHTNSRQLFDSLGQFTENYNTDQVVAQALTLYAKALRQTVARQ